MRPQYSNLGHVCFRRLDRIAQFVIASSSSVHALLHFLNAADFLLLQENQRLGHFFQIVLFCPPRIAFAFALGELCLNVHQQVERLLFRWLLLMWAVFGISCNDRLDFIFTVSCSQCPKTDKALLPCSFDRSVLSPFDFVAPLFQLLKKALETCRFLAQQDVVDYGTQLITIAFSGRIKSALLPFSVRLDFNNRQLMFQTDQIAQPLHGQPGQ